MGKFGKNAEFVYKVEVTQREGREMKKKNNSSNGIGLIILSIVFSFSAFLMLHAFFDKNINNFTIEILAAVLGSIVVVASTAIILRFQAEQDKEKIYSTSLFERKLQIYEALLMTIFKADDDNRVSREEVLDVENQVGLACLVANADLVSVLSQFIYQFKVYGVLYPRSMNEDQIAHYADFVRIELGKEMSDTKLAFSKFRAKKLHGNESGEIVNTYFVTLDDLIQEIRKDLSVVEGDIQHCVGHFVSIRYDHHGIIKKPNLVDDGVTRA